MISRSAYYIRSIFCILVIMACAMPAMAKTDFEKEWKKPIKEVPIWMKAANYKGDIPVGFAEFCIADVDKNNEHVANFSLNGVVIPGSKKDDKKFTIMLEDAALKFTDGKSNNLDYSGKLILNFDYDKSTKESSVSVTLTTGTLTVNGIDYLPIDAETVDDGDNIINFDIVYDPQSKLKVKSIPPFTADFKDLYVTRRVYVFDETMNETETEDIYRKWEGSRTPTPNEEKYYDFLRAVSASGTNFSDFRNTHKWVLIKESPASQFSGQSIAHFKDANHTKPFLKYLSTEEMIIPEATIAAGYHVKLNGDTIEVAKNGVEAKFVGDELFSATWPTLGASYQSGNLKRRDNSLLTGVAGWPSSKAAGYLLRKLDAVSLLSDTEHYDLREIPGNTMTAFAYISPLNEYEPILDGGNVIKSLKDKADRETRRQQIDEFLSRPMGIDRSMLAINGLAKSYSETSTRPGAGTTVITFSEDGRFDGRVPFLTFDIILPWSKFPDGSGKTLVKEGTSKVQITVGRDSQDHLAELTTSAIGSAMGKDYTITNRFVYDGDRLSEWANTEMELEKVTTYIYDNAGRILSATTKTGGPAGFNEKTVVKYTYTDFDMYGNWLSRNVECTTTGGQAHSISDGTTDRWTETRTYEYYTPNEDDIIRQMEIVGFGGN